MSIKLVALDTDGTLLNSQSKILDSTKKVVAQALAAGVKVVLCSGRPIAGLAPYMAELGITGDDQYAVTLNGAITRTASGKVQTEDILSHETYLELTEFARAHHTPFNVVAPDSKIITADHDIDFMVYVQAYENTATLYVRQPSELPADFQPAKGAFVGTKEQLDQIEPLVRERFDQNNYVVRADDRFLEIMHPNVNKGQGLRELCQKIGIKPAEVMAVGDAGNDLTMFEFAGVAVAMGNGTPEAKAAADFVTGSNDADGIAQAFEKFVF
ncbi:Cof-type HAD-IIB family hydrolase [Lactobacillus corticis]|uniref:Sugar phosphate phosphatase n=1 Tax=Lactobacillus corticis TaxID=2201249 RepID=A0A916QJ50_9LACO|nr:Cof-type HAD-IIB family hydrolase [Lactobacillus corticis]GFZ27458.1 sugar phosphate phosphatase [Lactobacillus corticis]